MASKPEQGNEMRLRVGVIGAGAWALANHVPILAASSLVDLEVAVNMDPASFDILRSNYGFRHATSDYREALQRGLDLVVVSSPAAFHYEHTRGALEAGAHVLCEKPFTIRSSDAWELARLADSVERHLVIAFGWNYGTIARETEQLLARHDIGPLEHAVVIMSSGVRDLLQGAGSSIAADDPRTPDYRTWTDRGLSGGGYGQAQLSHALALLLGLTADSAREVFALTTPDSSSHLDLHDAIVMRLASGATAVVSGSSYGPKAVAVHNTGEPHGRHTLLVRLVGTLGQLIADFEHDLLSVHLSTGESEAVRLPVHAGLYTCDGPPQTVLDLALGRNPPNRTPASLGARTVEILEAAYTSALEHGVVEIGQGRE